MGRINISGFILLLGRLLLAAVFIMAALPKLQDPVAFAVSIEGYRVIHGEAAMWTAIALPWLELVVGLGLLVPWLQRASALSLAALLLLFIGLHASAWARGLDIECGCFGESANALAYHWLILRNLALLLISVFILFKANRNKLPTAHSI